MPYPLRQPKPSNKSLSLKKYKVRTVAWATCVTMLVTPISIQAENLSSALDNMFISNVTDAGSFSTQGRTGFSAGSIVARTPVLPIHVASFDPPRFNGGCGGIDMYGGAFSFINADQLVKLFRAIVANALSALFWMAIDLVAKPIANVMKSFQALVTSLNMNMKNTCAIGNQIAKTAWSGAAANTAESLWKSVTGPISGAFSGFIDTAKKEYENFGRVNPSEMKDPAKPDQVQSPTWGNMTWRALVRSEADRKFQSASPSLSNTAASVADRKFTMEILMSILGTQITDDPKKSPGTQNYPTPGATPDVTPGPKNGNLGIPFNPSITNIHDFIMGPQDGVSIKKYKCDETMLTIKEDDCKTITTETLTPEQWQGVKGKVNKAIYGDLMGQAFLEGGIVDKLRKCETVSGQVPPLNSGNNPCNFTPDQVGIINGTTVPLLYLLQRSQGNVGLMQATAEQLSYLVALDYAGNLYKQLIEVATSAFSGVEGLNKPAYVGEIITAITAEYNYNKSQFKSNQELVEIRTRFIEQAVRNIGSPG